jgi:hypothetical protein
MTTTHFSLTHLSDREVIAEVARVASAEREATARLVVALAELDARRLYLGEGCSSLFTYCVDVLRLSEHAAYGRIEAARAGRQFPVIFEMLLRGQLTVTTVRLVARALTPDNHRDVLTSAIHKKKREVEELVARLRPQPDVPAVVRKLPPTRVALLTDRETVAPSALLPTTAPTPAASSSIAAPAPPAVQRSTIAPLAPERYKVQLTVGRETHDKLKRVQDLMRHSVPNGDPAIIFDRALTALLAEIQKAKLAATDRPRSGRRLSSGSRHIPAAVKRAVWKRDAGRCAFVGTRGRCREIGFLEFHHVLPFAAGGAATEENLELRCAAHNQHEADLFFGTGAPLLARERPSAFGRVDSVWTELSACESRDVCGPGGPLLT